MIFRFSRYELDEEAGELRCEGAAVELQPKPLALLRLLVRARDRVVSHDELMDALWPGVAVTPSSLTRAVSTARRAIGDTHRGETLRSVARRGYRFAADVVEVAARRPEAPAAPLAQASSPFVGRDEALGRLQAAFERACSGRGGVVGISGQAGIGKTRLTEVFGEHAAKRGALWLVGRAREGEGVPGFWIWAQVLRRLSAHPSGAEALRELAGVSSQLDLLVPGLSPDLANAASHEQSQFRLLDGVARALARAGRSQPLVICLEDLQWAGADALRLVEHLAYEVPELPALIVATLRDEPRPSDHPLELALPRLRQHPACEWLELRALSRRDVAVLLSHSMGAPAPTDLSSELFARTEGVPLFVREAIRLLQERGDLRAPERERSWAISLPARSFDLIRGPLARLSAGAALLVGAASVLGREFAGSLAAAIVERGREEALGDLDEATRAGVLGPGEGPDHWRFVHALFREAAYQALAPSQRARLHRRAAEELERRHSQDADTIAAEVAHHRHEALALGDVELACEWAERAAARAERLMAWEQAAHHYDQALAALASAEEHDPARRLALLIRLGEALQRTGSRARRRAVFLEALDLGQMLQQPIEVARAAIGLCDLSEWAPRTDEAGVDLERVQAALETLPVDAEPTLRAQLITRLAYLTGRIETESATRIAREGLALARKSDNPSALQESIYTLFFLLAGPDALDERASLASEAERAARRNGAADPTIITLLDLACDSITRGDAAAATRARNAAGEVAGTHAHLGRVWHLRANDAGRAIANGHFAEAAAAIEESSKLGERIAHPYARGLARIQRATLARERGDHAEVLRVFDPHRPLRWGPLQFVSAFVARSLLAEGRRDEARALFEEVLVDGVDGIPRNIRWYSVLAETSLLCAELGDERWAKDLYTALVDYSGQHAVLPLAAYLGPIDRCLARLAEMLGRTDEARERFEAAAEQCTAIGTLPTRAHILLELGSLLARAGARGPARTRFEDCARLASQLGMRGVEEAARARLG